SCLADTVVCDESNGRDVGGNAFIRTLDSFSAMSTAGSQGQRIAAGKDDVLIQVKAWNGQPDDPQVVLSSLLWHGIIPAFDGGTTKPPVGDGTDQWTIDPQDRTATFPDDDGGFDYLPAVNSRSAWIANNVLVAKLDTMSITIGTSGRMFFHDAI